MLHKTENLFFTLTIMSRLYVYGLISDENIYAFAVFFRDPKRRMPLSADMENALTKVFALIRARVFFGIFSDSRLLVDG